MKRFLCIAGGTGADARLDIGVPFRPKAWPRAGVRISTWKWRILHGYPWSLDRACHINVLEARAALNGTRWRLRRGSALRSRWLHLVDSQVVAAVLTKARSSSGRLQRVLRRHNALLLASGGYPIVAYVSSEDNPADIPSRWARMPRWRHAKLKRRSGVASRSTSRWSQSGRESATAKRSAR